MPLNFNLSDNACVYLHNWAQIGPRVDPAESADVKSLQFLISCLK